MEFTHQDATDESIFQMTPGQHMDNMKNVDRCWVATAGGHA